MSTFIILSGKYISADMIAEFGRLPPAFLPRGMQPLYDSQIEFARRYSDRVFLLIPEDFQPSRTDVRKLSDCGIQILYGDSEATLAQALRRAVEAAHLTGPLHILHGDTLVSLPAEHPSSDFFAAGAVEHYSFWAEYDETSDGKIGFHQKLISGRNLRSILCGYFVFHDGALYREILSTTDDFVVSLNAYAAQRALAPVQAVEWLDFGHLHTYFHSRKTSLSSRSFNQVIPSRYGIRKSGAEHQKIIAEANWFRNAPPAMQPFLPALYDVEDGSSPSYELEYLFLPSLSELLVFGRLPIEIWQSILSSCGEFLAACHDIGRTPGQIADGRFFDEMIVDKTMRRIEAFCGSREISPEREWRVNGRPMPSIERTVEKLIGSIPRTMPHHMSWLHGDFHFANIFYDFRARRVRVVDPRGMLPDGRRGFHGDIRYDVAKLTHSVIGLYDFIVAGRYDLSGQSYELSLSIDAGDDVAVLQDYFSALDIRGCSARSSEILAMTSLLFFSMLPLHHDSALRQQAFLANAYRLAAMAESVS